jgi:RNA polymerase sigma-70 factor (ECF subfamily)
MTAVNVVGFLIVAGRGAMANALKCGDGPDPLSQAAASPDSTCRLVERARAGEVDALNELFSRHLTALRRWTSGRLPRSARDIADTQDLVQETALHTFNRIGQFQSRHAGSLQAYLRRAVINRIRNEFRRARRHSEAEPVTESAVLDATSPLEAAIRHEQEQRYRVALSRLTARERDLLIGRLELGFSYEELAAIYGKPSANAARMAIARALLRLAAELQGE